MWHKGTTLCHIFNNFIRQQIGLNARNAVSFNAFHCIECLHQIKEGLSGAVSEVTDIHKTVNNAYTSGPAVAGLPQNQNGERWNNNFDYYQTLTGLQNGVYELKAQAFYRTGSNADAWSQHTSESEEILAWIYINDNKAAVPSIMEYPRTEAELAKGVANDGQLSTVTGNCYSPGSNDDGVTIYTPNGQNSASAFFSIGDYECNVYGIVTDGTLRLGI